MEQQTGSKSTKEYVKAIYCHPTYLTYLQSTSCEMLGWMEHKLESRLQGEISVISDMQMTPPYGRKRRTKVPLDENGRCCCCYWVASVMSDSVRPLRWQPLGSPIPGILQTRTLEWVAISFSNAWKWKVKVMSLSSVQLLVTPWTAAYQAPLAMVFSRQEYWSGL